MAETLETAELEMLDILENKTGISVAKLDTAISVMECVTEAMISYPSLQSIGRNKETNTKLNTLYRLKVAAISFLSTVNLGRKAKRSLNPQKIANRKKIEKSKHPLPPPVRVGIKELRKENALKWQKTFHSSGLKSSNNCISNEEIPSTPSETEPHKENDEQHVNCYICKSSIVCRHHFYNKLCLECANFNFEKRNQTANLVGKVALVTGGRLKIGYEVVLKLLRCGAMVIVTTRFPANAAKRYSSEVDYKDWKDRLHIYALDLRFIRHVEEFCSFISKNYDRLDILIQNAAQTIRRPVAFYRHLFNDEINSENQSSLIHSWDFQHAKLNNHENNSLLSSHLGSIPKSVQASQMLVHPEDHQYCESITEINKHFPTDCYDEDHQQVDLRPNNSWVLEADQVETAELIEVNLVNYIAPYLFLSKLTPLLKKSVTTTDSFGSIILVSAMEGKFNRFKTSKHPHTNCAKASLNMIVRTSAQYYKESGLLLNAVDTGWVTDEDPAPLKRSEGIEPMENWEPPIDCIDGASRILDPVFKNINNGDTTFGVFLKDYLPSDW